MRFNKIIVATLLLMCVLSSVCCAAFDKGTWLCIHKENDIKYYTNREYIQFLDNSNTAIVWIASGPWDEPPGIFAQMIIRSNKTYADVCCFASLETDFHDLVVGPYPKDIELCFYSIKPHTKESTIYRSLFRE